MLILYIEEKNERCKFIMDVGIVIGIGYIFCVAIVILAAWSIK